MTDTDFMPAPPRKTRWYQFRLRTLLIFMVLAAVGMSCFAVQWRRAQRERMLVDMLRRSGYWVVYDWESKAPEPSGPRWLCVLGGAYGRWQYATPDGAYDRNRIGSVTLVNSRLTDAEVECLKMLPMLMSVAFAPSSRISDEVLAQLQRLPGVDRLSLAHTDVTDAELASLQKLHWLSTLDLAGTKVGDPGLVHLKGLTRLIELDLSDTQVSDAGARHLESLSGLGDLRLSGTKIGDAALVHVGKLSRLCCLTLNGTKVTDAGLAHLKGLHDLDILGLEDTQVTDAGLVHLKGLTNLVLVDLIRSKITDAGLVHLRTLNRLHTVLVGETAVTEEGATELQRALPMPMGRVNRREKHYVPF